MIPRVSCQRDQGGSQTLVGPENQEMVTAHKKMLGVQSKVDEYGCSDKPRHPQKQANPWQLSTHLLPGQ